MSTTAPSSPLPGPSTAAAAMIAGALAAAAGAVFALGEDFCLDDAYIHLAYARNLRGGAGLSYNPGDQETGFSSPLWVALLATLPIERAPHLPVKALGVACHALTAGLAVRLTMRLAGRAGSWGALAAGGLVALHPGLLQGATSGMEVPLAAALCLAAAEATLAMRAGWAFVAGALALWARPEALFFLGALGGLWALARRDARPLAASAGATCALGLWCAYCLHVSGYPWPNTHYVKAGSHVLAGLEYLALRVLPEEPWLVGVGGLPLLWRALRAGAPQRAAASALLGAWLVTLVATATGRNTHPSILFYLSRYFLIVAAVPALLIGSALTRGSRSTWWWLAPVIVAQGWLATRTWTRQRDQESDIARLHTAVAQHVARTLPSEARVLVEGAGALRYYTPPSMTIIDMLGLNDRDVAHAGGAERRACLWIARRPGYVAIPLELGPRVARAFQLRAIREFEEPHYAQAETPVPRRVGLFQVVGLAHGAAQRCATLIAGAPPERD